MFKMTDRTIFVFSAVFFYFIFNIIWAKVFILFIILFFILIVVFGYLRGNPLSKLLNNRGKIITYAAELSIIVVFCQFLIFKYCLPFLKGSSGPFC